MDGKYALIMLKVATSAPTSAETQARRADTSEHL
jgi:hypothetical protein